MFPLYCVIFVPVVPIVSRAVFAVTDAPVPPKLKVVVKSFRLNVPVPDITTFNPTSSITALNTDGTPSVGVGVGDGIAVSVGVGAGIEVSVGVGVGAGIEVSVGVGTGIEVSVGVGVGVINS